MENRGMKQAFTNSKKPTQYSKHAHRNASTSIDDLTKNLYLEESMSVRVLTRLYPTELMLAKSGDGVNGSHLSNFLNGVTVKLAGYCFDLNVAHDENNFIRGTTLFWLKVFSQPFSAALKAYKADFMKMIEQCITLDILPEEIGEPYLPTHTVQSKEEDLAISLSVINGCSDGRVTAGTNHRLEDIVDVEIKQEPVELTSAFYKPGVLTENLLLPQDTEIDIEPEPAELEPEQLSQEPESVNNHGVFYYCDSCSTLHVNSGSSSCTSKGCTESRSPTTVQLTESSHNSPKATDSTHYPNSKMFPCAARGFHIHRAEWKPRLEQVLEILHEADDEDDPYCMALQYNGNTIGYVPRELSRASFYFVRHGGRMTAFVTRKEPKISPMVQGGLEIPITVIASSDNNELLARLMSLVGELYEDSNDNKYSTATDTLSDEDAMTDTEDNHMET